MSRRHKRQQVKVQRRSAQTSAGGIPSGISLARTGSTAGEIVNEAAALSVSAIFAAIQVIACDVAKLPINVIRSREDGSRTRLPKHPLQQVLDDPNIEMTRVGFMEAWVGSALLWGTGYVQIIRNGYGDPVELFPFQSWQVMPRRDIHQRLYYDVYPGGNWPIGSRDTPSQIAAQDMLVLPNFGFNGIQGLAAVRVGREAVGLSIALQKYAASLFGNGARPGGILTNDGVLKPDAAKKLVESWEAAHGGAGRQHGTALLEGGTKWTKIAGTPDESQMIESRMFQIEEVCRLFRVPPSKLAHLVKTAFSSAEQFALEYVTDTLSTWTTRIEAELKKKLINEPDVQVDVDETALIRADVKTLADMASALFNGGIWTRNESRVKTGENPVEGGDIFLNPKASVVVSRDSTVEEQQQIAAPPAPPALPAPEPEAQPEPEPEPQAEQQEQNEQAGQIRQLATGIKPLLVNEIRRLLRVETDKITRALKKDDFSAWTETFYRSHAEHVRAALAPSVQSFAAMAGVVSKLDLSGATAAIPGLVQRYVSESRADLADRDGIEERVAGWEEYRAASFVDAVVEELIGVLS